MRAGRHAFLGSSRPWAWRLAAHGQAWTLHGQGWLGQAIARHLWSETVPECKGRGDAGHSLLDPWQHVVLEHWSSGRRHGIRLFRVLQRNGYRGSYPTLARYLQRLRAAQATVLAHKSAR